LSLQRQQNTYILGILLISIPLTSFISLIPQYKKKAKLAIKIEKKRTFLTNSLKTIPWPLIASIIEVVIDSEFARVSETSVIKKIPQYIVMIYVTTDRVSKSLSASTPNGLTFMFSTRKRIKIAKTTIA
jgi:hypothetical protein